MTQQDKINALATGVMGWVLPDDKDMPCAWMEWETPEKKNRVWAGYWCEPPATDDEYLIGLLGSIAWNPYESWDHAGMMVERLVEKYQCGVSINAIEPKLILPSGHKFSCRITGGNLWYRTQSLFANYPAATGPAAICEAALATQGD